MRRLGLLSLSLLLVVGLLAAPSSSAAKAKKCKPPANSSATVSGLHVKGLNCSGGRELSLAYALGSEEAVADVGYDCTRKPLKGAPGAFRVKCVGAGSKRGKLLRFNYRP